MLPKKKKSAHKRKPVKRKKSLRRKVPTKRKVSTTVAEPQVEKDPLKVGPVANTPFRELIVRQFPNLTGYDFAEIIGILEANGVRVEVEKKLFSDNTVTCIIDQPAQDILSSYPEKT
jgi:hypothetical protein